MKHQGCNIEHRTHRTLAKCRWKPAWIMGSGRYALVSYCLSSNTVTLHPTIADAERSKRVIDNTKCGGKCRGAHHIYALGAS